MSSALAKLNLRPQERRLVVFVAIVVFVVLNIWFVWPHFGDWTTINIKQERAERTLRNYETEIQKTKGYQVKLRELESAGSSVVPEEQELDLVRVVDTQARINGLYLIALDTHAKQSTTETNRFFEEQYVTLHATSDNEQLINFLISLTSTNSLIRVKDMTLKPADMAATRLDEQLTLVASYQRKTPAKSQPQLSPATTNLGVAKAAAPHPLVRTNKTAGKQVAGKAAGAGTNRTANPRSRLTNHPAKKP